MERELVGDVLRGLHPLSIAVCLPVLKNLYNSDLFQVPSQAYPPFPSPFTSRSPVSA